MQSSRADLSKRAHSDSESPSGPQAKKSSQSNMAEIGDNEIFINDNSSELNDLVFPESCSAVFLGKNITQHFFQAVSELHKHLPALLEKCDKQKESHTTVTNPDDTVEPNTHQPEKPLKGKTYSIENDLLEQYEKEYKDLKDLLNDNLYHFRPEDLRNNTKDDASFKDFVDLRKDLTQWYTGGQQLAKQILKYRQNGKVDIIKSNISIVPSTIPYKEQNDFFKEIEEVTQLQNLKALNYLLELSLDRTRIILHKLNSLECFIQAKAWRTVVLSNKDISDGAIYKSLVHAKDKRTTHKPRNEENETKRTENYPRQRDKHYRLPSKTSTKDSERNYPQDTGRRRSFKEREYYPKYRDDRRRPQTDRYRKLDRHDSQRYDREYPRLQRSYREKEYPAYRDSEEEDVFYAPTERHHRAWRRPFTTQYQRPFRRRDSYLN